MLVLYSKLSSELQNLLNSEAVFSVMVELKTNVLETCSVSVINFNVIGRASFQKLRFVVQP